MNKNILQPFRVEGTDEATLSEAVKWMNQHTFHRTVSTIDMKLLSYQSFQRRNGKYEVSFLSIDPCNPYVRRKDLGNNIFEFSGVKMSVSENIFDKIMESGIVMEIESQYFIVEPSTLSSFGDLLDCHGKILTEGSLGRDLCIADALINLDEMEFIYRQNTDKGIKVIMSFLGSRFSYTDLETCIEECFNLLSSPHEMEMYKWEMSNSGVNIYMEYPKYGFVTNEDEWKCGVCMRITNLAGVSTKFQWYARKDNLFVTLRSENVSHRCKAYDKVKSRFRNGFFTVYTVFRNEMMKMTYTLECRHARVTYELRGTNIVDVVATQTHLLKSLGTKRYEDYKSKLIQTVKEYETMSLYDMYLLFLTTGVECSRELNDRYYQMYSQSISKLPSIMVKTYSKFLKERKTNQIEGQLAFTFEKENIAN